MVKCPNCDKEFREVSVVHANVIEPFVAISPYEGIQAYGTIQMEKRLLCFKHGFCHFEFLDTGEERLVQILQYHAGDPLPLMAFPTEAEFEEEGDDDDYDEDEAYDDDDDYDEDEAYDDDEDWDEEENEDEDDF